MASVNDSTLIYTYPIYLHHIYNRLQHVACSSNTYRHNGGFLINKTGVHRVFLIMVKMNSHAVNFKYMIF